MQSATARVVQNDYLNLPITDTIGAAISAVTFLGGESATGREFKFATLGAR